MSALETVDADKVYVLGGLVDESIQKVIYTLEQLITVQHKTSQSSSSIQPCRCSVQGKSNPTALVIDIAAVIHWDYMNAPVICNMLDFYQFSTLVPCRSWASRGPEDWASARRGCPSTSTWWRETIPRISTPRSWLLIKASQSFSFARQRKLCLVLTKSLSVCSVWYLVNIPRHRKLDGSPAGVVPPFQGLRCRISCFATNTDLACGFIWVSFRPCVNEESFCCLCVSPQRIYSWNTIYPISFCT